MNILSFGNFARHKQSPAAQDWSNQELANFFRAHRLLANNGANIGMDRGRSDQGEPWMVFYDTTSQDVFLHIARIDNVCVLICEHLGVCISATQIDALIDKFEGEIRQAFAVRAERASNVVIHPAAKIIMSISAVFLLFKLDANSQAFAKDSGAHTGDVAARKNDSFHGRMQSVLGRLFDGAETPIAMAALATVILATEIGLDHGDNGADQTADNIDALSLKHTHESSLQLHRAEAPSGEQEQAENAPAIDVPVVEGLQASVDTAAIIPVITIDVAAPSQMHKPEVEGFALQTVQAEANSEGASDGTSQAVAIAEATVEKVEVAPTPATTTITLPADSLSIQVMKSVATLDFAELLDSSGSGLLVSASGDVTTTNYVGLDASVSEFGFEADTEFAAEDLTLMLEHIISSIGTYELEINGNTLSITQMSDTVIDQSDLGIWTNVMADGSSIAIIGAIDLIDDINGFAIAA